jgi:tryptophan synthase alpha chain
VSRIAAKFADLKKQGRGALIPFVEAWDPDQETSTQLLLGMPGAGADLIEIGMPFTDPMADGPIIQAAAKRALVSGVKVRFILDMVRTFRVQDQTTPIVLMGYLNPILSYGPEKFCVDARYFYRCFAHVHHLPKRNDGDRITRTNSSRFSNFHRY